MTPTVGVLALQGDVAEHVRILRSLGVDTLPVRRQAELLRCDGLVLPGGESTTMIKLARTFGLLDPLRAWLAEGHAAFGTCAGMILLADRILDGTAGQETIGGLDVTVRRNAFGRQVDSFEEDLGFEGLAEPVPAVFIRAPWVESAGEGVEVLARRRPLSPDEPGRIVAVRHGNLLATAFHPEVDDDARIHELFLGMVRG